MACIRLASRMGEDMAWKHTGVTHPHLSALNLILPSPRRVIQRSPALAVPAKINLCDLRVSVARVGGHGLLMPLTGSEKWEMAPAPAHLPPRGGRRGAE